MTQAGRGERRWEGKGEREREREKVFVDILLSLEEFRTRRNEKMKKTAAPTLEHLLGNAASASSHHLEDPESMAVQLIRRHESIYLPMHAGQHEWALLGQISVEHH